MTLVISIACLQCLMVPERLIQQIQLTAPMAVTLTQVLKRGIPHLSSEMQAWCRSLAYS